MPQPETTKPTAAPLGPERVQLLLADFDWRAGLDAPTAEAVARSLVLPVVDLTGKLPWLPEGSMLVLLEGRVLRSVDLCERRAVQLLGPGDVIAAAPTGSAPPLSISCTSIGPVRAARLDGSFVRACQRWPSLTDVLLGRLVAQEQRALLQLAISGLPRVEQRLLAMLWHLAERFGRMTAQGAVVDLRLRHQDLGRLIGAARPTVSLAGKALEASGMAFRTDDRRWRLPLSGLDALSGSWSDAPPQAREGGLDASTVARGARRWAATG